MIKKITFSLLAIVSGISGLVAQTNPTAQSLPFSQNFNTLTGSTTTYPAGFQGWTIPGSLSTSYVTTAPNGNQTLAGANNSSSSAGVYDMVGKMGVMSTGSALRGICLALNTTGSSNITLSFDAGTQGQTSGGRINELMLQYRIGTSSTFTNIPASTYSNNATSTTTSGTNATNTVNISLVLPSDCNNQSVVQLRWTIRDVSGSGNRPFFSIDNVLASASSPTVAITGQDPNTPSAVNWALGSTANQFYWASLSPSGGNATLSSVTANMSGTYLAADIATNGLKLYYSSDATLVPAGDVLLGSQSSAKSGATENVTWSSLSQAVATGSTGYIYATADVLAGATVGRTLAGSFSSDANIVFTPTVSYGSNSYGATTDKTFAALPTNPSVFSLSCASEAKLNVTMNAPTTGTVLVFANTTGTFTNPTGSGAGFTGANANYASATNYPAVGGKLVYSGPGSNFTVSGLSAGQTYSLKAYSYSGSSWSSGTAVISGLATTQPVSGIVASPSSGQISLSWSNPAATACYNNVIVIARQGSAVEAAVSKTNFDGLISDADLTGANANWTLNGNSNDIYDLTATLVGTDNTNFLVYKGTGTSVNLTGLTNGTPYYFRVFTVDGSGAAAKWSAGIDINGTPDQPGYYWNGGNISASPANGGTGTWGTANAWRQPTITGSQATWSNGNAAIFGGIAGVVTIDNDRSATSYLFNTNSYTLQTTSGTTRVLTGPITLANNNELVLSPNLPSTTDGAMSVGSIGGSGTASVRIHGNQGSSAAAKVNIAAANATVSLPTNITTASGTGFAGYVGTNSGVVVSGNIINNSALTTIIGATSGNEIFVNGVISGTSGLQFSAGASGGAGDVYLNSANTYSGGTFFNCSSTGVVSLGINNALPVNGDVTMSSGSSFGGVFNLNGYSQSVGNLTNNFTIGSIVNNGASSSSLTVNQTTAQSFGLAIKDGSGTVALIKNGAAAWTLTNNTHSFSGGLILNNGEIRFNPSASMATSSVCPVSFNGGSLASTGIAAGRVVTFSTMRLSDNSAIALNPSTTHTLNFAASNAISWTSSKTLVITGWQGTYTTTTGSSGTAGKIFVGNNASALTNAQLSQIKFSDGVTSYDAILLANGELVPHQAAITTQLRTSYCGYTAQSFGEFIGADSVLTANHYRFQIVNAAQSYTQTFTNSSGYPYLALYLLPGISYNTTYTVTVAWSADGTTFSSYGAACTLTSPAAEYTQLVAGSCGVTYSGWNNLISADQVSGATNYRFKLANAALSYTQTFTNVNQNFNFSLFSGLTASTPYTVSVAVELLGTWNPYGTECVVTTPAAPTSSMLPQYCGYAPSSYSELMTAEAQIGSSYRFKLENTSLGYSQTFTNVNRNVNLAQYSGLVAGTTYSISVSVFHNGGYGPYGPECTVIAPAAPTSSMLPQYCGYTPSSYSELMTAERQAGSSYMFKLENTILGYSQTFTNVNPNVNLVQYTGLTAGATYSISVRVFNGGGWGSYGNVCQITVPSSLPTTSVVSVNCGYTPANFSELMNVEPVTGSTNYEYKLENASLGYSQTFTNVNRNFNFAVFPGVTVNTTYTISARVYFNGSWGAYGPACTVTTPASAIILNGNNGSVASSTSSSAVQRQGMDSDSREVGTFDVMAYPNPFNGVCSLNLLSYQVNENVVIRVYDATGKLVEAHSLLPGDVKKLEIGADYAKGLYNIIVGQGSQTKSIKVIRQ